MTGRIPVPFSFVLVVGITIALIIFFGAWAVSVDRAQQQRTLYFGLASNASLGVGGALGTEAPPALDRIDGAAAGSTADTWWGKGLLAACPLH